MGLTLSGVWSPLGGGGREGNLTTQFGVGDLQSRERTQWPSLSLADEVMKSLGQKVPLGHRVGAGWKNGTRLLILFSIKHDWNNLDR